MRKSKKNRPSYFHWAVEADVPEHVVSRHVRAGSRRGVTLVEVCVSAAILVLLFSGLSATMAAGRRGASLAENRAAALHIARQEMEKLRTLDFFASALAVKTHNLLPAGRGYYKVTSVDVRTKNVEVVIQWREPSGRDNEVSVITTLSGSLHR